MMKSCTKIFAGIGIAFWVLITCLPLILFFWFDWAEFHIHRVEKEVPAYLGGWIRGVRSDLFMPQSARQLEYSLLSGWATSLDWKCRVPEEDFLRFADQKKWKISHQIPEEHRYAWSQSYEKAQLPSSFYYIFVPSVSNGGLNVLYDRKKQMMYGSYASR